MATSSQLHSLSSAPLPLADPSYRPTAPAPPRAADTLRPDFRHTEFQIEPFIKHTLSLKLDADSTLCRPFSTTGACPLGPSCPLRHVSASPLNFLPPQPIPQSAHARTVCKHWLRGLCKKGASCDFMHEYHLRKMPECWFFAKYGFCSNGDECMYLHVTEDMRIRECPQYRKGFCRLGPECPLKHIRRVVCPDYLIGFCAKGPECPFGHPSFDPPPDPPSSSTRIPDVSGARGRGGGGGGYGGGGGGYGDRPKRDVSQIDCYRCGQKGHYANNCPNPNVPGNRGGNERAAPQQHRY
ncbi:hypothetical protein BCR35DRAFT_342403 [Leucosporidium creatinivorum]|uniref:mRNA 3'-end-processing protein n=1 Tax=Leucosporidium creatinivorum TaxID=106004 RepID=A0A1Y2F2B6_9BASI|nr:hypothetical protein BCR35DRAFT_342403 [Leucosporidium creatinivorum]